LKFVLLFANLGKEILLDELSSISGYFKKERLVEFINECTKKDLDDLKHSNKLFEAVHLILKYSSQFQKDAKLKKLSAARLAENKQIDIKLAKCFSDFYEDNIGTSSFHQISTLNAVFDIMYTVSTNSLNDPGINAKYIQESLLDMLTKMLIMFAVTVKKVYALHYQPDKISRTLIFKPLQAFSFCEKLVEQAVKLGWCSSCMLKTLCLFLKEYFFKRFIHQ